MPYYGGGEEGGGSGTWAGPKYEQKGTKQADTPPGGPPPGGPPPGGPPPGGNDGGDSPLADWALGNYDRWDPSGLGSRPGEGSYSTSGGGNVAGYGDFSYDKMSYDPYSGADIDYQNINYDAYQSDFEPTSFDQAYTADRFEGSTDPYIAEKFARPTYEQAQQDPGYQFRLQQGQQALENSAAASGMLRTGGTMKGLMDYNQAAASQEYDKSYGRALGEYQMGYGQDVRSDQDQWARQTQKHGMNRQGSLDQYDRQFQRHQSNEAGRVGAEQMRRGAHQMNTAGRMGAHQMNLSGELGARSANMQKYGMNLGAQQGAHDRNYQGNLAQYQFGLSRAQHADSEAQAANSRAAHAAGAGQRSWDERYARERGEYMTNYGQDVYRDETRWNRLGDLGNTPYTEPPPGG